MVVEPLTDFVDRFNELAKVFLENDEVISITVNAVRPLKNQMLLRFEGIESREAAEKLVGKFLSVPKSDLVELPEETYFQFDIVGMQVYAESGEYLGDVAEVIPMPANDLWRVTGKKEFLLPATRNIVQRVDRNERKVYIHLLEGLIDG